MNKATRLLQDARDLIDHPDKWTKGTLYDQGRYCMLGAIQQAEASTKQRVGSNHIARNRLLETGIAMFPSISFRGIASINDHPDTTHDDILAMFDKAILSEPV